MKNNLCVVLVFVLILLTFSTFAQDITQDSISLLDKALIDKPLIRKIPIALELDIFGATAFIGKKISNKMSINFGIGIYPYSNPSYLLIKPDFYTTGYSNFFSTYIFGSYHFNQYLAAEIGGKYAYELHHSSSNRDDGGGFYFSTFLSVHLGIKHFKLGSRLLFTRIKIIDTHFLLMTEPVFLRITF
jgi:hypothetical protein